MPEGDKEGVKSQRVQVISPFSTEETRKRILRRICGRNRPREYLAFCPLKWLLDFWPSERQMSNFISCMKPSAWW